MPGVISDICSRVGWSVEYVRSFPPETIIGWWKDWIHESWFDRGKEPEQVLNNTEKLEEIKRKAGF